MEAPDLHSITGRAEAWFGQHQRPLPWRRRYDPYQIWVSEVMLQQTRMEVVLPYFERFTARFPTILSLASSTEDEVTAAWSGLGYYRRARMLREGAIEVMNRFGGMLPQTVEELRTIPGIGRYTAGAIASIAFQERSPIVDGNVARVVARLFGAAGDDWARATALVDACSSPRSLNQALMELGALICTPRNPGCLLCPLRQECIAHADGTVETLPPPRRTKETRTLRIRLFIIQDDRQRLLMRREAGPLMHAMYHLPHGEATLLSGRPLDARPRQLLGSFRHTITTRKIEFAVYTAETTAVRDGEGGYEWIDPAELDAVPHPSYVKKALRLVG